MLTTRKTMQYTGVCRLYLSLIPTKFDQDACMHVLCLEFCLKKMCSRCPSRAETVVRCSCHCLIALSISCWSILSHSSELQCLLIFVRTHTHTQSFYRSFGICLGPPGWAGTRKVKTRKVKPIWIYWSKRQWVAVASAGQYASLYLIQITTPTSHHSVFYRPDALPAAQPPESKHWRTVRQKMFKITSVNK